MQFFFKYFVNFKLGAFPTKSDENYSMTPFDRQKFLSHPIYLRGIYPLA